MLFLDAVNALLLFLIKSVCPPPPPSSPDLITTSGWCHHYFCYSGDCVSRGNNGNCWSVALPAHRAACCTASFKEKRSVSASAPLTSSHVSSLCYKYGKRDTGFSNISGRKPRHRRPESPTPDITVKKDKYNKGNVAACISLGLIKQVLLNKRLSIAQDIKLVEEPRLKLSKSRKEYITMLKCL